MPQRQWLRVCGCMRSRASSGAWGGDRASQLAGHVSIPRRRCACRRLSGLPL